MGSLSYSFAIPSGKIIPMIVYVKMYIFSMINHDNFYFLQLF